MPVLFAAAEFQHGNERAVAECFHVVLYCRVTALSHNIRAHDEMVNLDKRTLSSAPWGGEPSLCLAPVRLALLWCPPFWHGWIGRSLQETPCAEPCETGCSLEMSVLCSPQRHREPAWLAQGAGHTFILCSAALCLPGFSSQPLPSAQARECKSHWVCLQMLFLINFPFLLYFLSF